jgi:hypothetical protein
MDNQLQKTGQQALTANQQRLQSSLTFKNLIIQAAANDQKAKNDLQAITARLMPQGKPTYTEVVNYAPIAALIAEKGYQEMHMVVGLMLTDLNSALNVVRPMNETQIQDAAHMMVDECGDFRLEDYHMMFQMARRGQLVKIMDRLDINIISQMMDEYYLKRRLAGQLKQENEHITYEQSIDKEVTPEELEEANRRVQEMMQAWKEDKRSDDEAFMQRRQEQIENFARLYKLDFDEIKKQFTKK